MCQHFISICLIGGLALVGFHSTLDLFAQDKNEPSCDETLLYGSEPEELFATALQDTHYHYLMRGVAPGEAKVAGEKLVSMGPGEDGRLQQRAHYAIDGNIKPAYVMGRWENPPIDDEDLHLMFNGLRHYANEGAALERYWNDNEENASNREDQVARSFAQRIGIRNDTNSRGYVLVYRVPATVELEYHPESRAPVPKRVVATPVGAELLGIMSSDSIPKKNK